MVKARQMNSRSEEQTSSPNSPSVHPGSFALGSLESRAAARVLAEWRETSTFHCSICFMSGLGIMDSNRPEFIPNENMERGPDGWTWKCPRHKDRSREATVQALMELGLMGGPIP